MRIFNWQLNGFFILVLSIINSQSLASTQSGSVHLEPPNLSGQYRDNRPPFQPSDDVNTNQKPGKTVARSNGVYPCDGSFLKTNGTTCGLKEIMIGRCYEYQYVRRGLYLSNTTAIKNCTELYELFETAVRYKSFCEMHLQTYEKYFDHALEGVKVINRAMFWSGSYAVAHAYGGNGLNYITLEDTLAAAMANGLVWCGKENDTEGFDYVSCPARCQDNPWADAAFWGIASRTFAERATGEIYAVLNGTRTDGQPAFRNNSYFATYELSHFQNKGPDRVTKINILLMHTPDFKVVERCGEKSLITLENEVRKRGFDYVCQDDPEELILIMCADAWEARECQLAKQVLRHEWDRKVYGNSMANHHSTSILFLPLFLISGRLLSSDVLKF